MGAEFLTITMAESGEGTGGTPSRHYSYLQLHIIAYHYSYNYVIIFFLFFLGYAKEMSQDFLNAERELFGKQAKEVLFLNRLFSLN